MTDINPTRRRDEPPARDGAPLAGWPTVIAAEEAVALRGALKQLQTALDAVVRERDEARAEVERLHRAHQAACEGGDLLRATLLAEVERLRREAERFRWLAAQKSLHLYTDGGTWTRDNGTTFRAWGVLVANRVGYPPAETLAEMVDIARADQEDGR